MEDVPKPADTKPEKKRGFFSRSRSGSKGKDGN
jgi:hypothetical protein